MTMRLAVVIAFGIGPKSVASSVNFTPSEFNLSSQQPVKIGFAAQDHFHGRMTDVRIHQGALSTEEIQRLANGAE